MVGFSITLLKADEETGVWDAPVTPALNWGK
jgi:dihydroxyacetone kinase